MQKPRDIAKNYRARLWENYTRHKSDLYGRSHLISISWWALKRDELSKATIQPNCLQLENNYFVLLNSHKNHCNICNTKLVWFWINNLLYTMVGSLECFLRNLLAQGLREPGRYPKVAASFWFSISFNLMRILATFRSRCAHLPHQPATHLVCVPSVTCINK